MNDESMEKTIDAYYDTNRENWFASAARVFYSRRMLSVAILVWAHFLFFLALALVCGYLFLESDQTKDQIMYAAFFVCCIQIGYMIKVYAWQIVNRHSIQREVKRLELRFTELCQSLKERS